MIGGNVAECAGGPRAFKYGTTKRYVLGLEAVLPTGEVVRTGGKTVKNVVGYDLTQLLVGSEGTLAIVTQIVLGSCRSRRSRRHCARRFLSRIRGRPPSPTDSRARRAAALELIDGDCWTPSHATSACDRWRPEGTAALLLLEVDGIAEAVEEEARARRTGVPGGGRNRSAAGAR